MTFSCGISLSKIKNKARQENIKLFKDLSGYSHIPENKQLWSLCAEQPNKSGTEIVQYIENGLIQKFQFNGIDRNKEVIEKNKKYHPEANWHHGELIDIISIAIENGFFNPAFIYLDYTGFAESKKNIEDTLFVLNRVPEETCVFVNLMTNDPRSRKVFSLFETFKMIDEILPNKRKWKSEIPNYYYNASGKTDMGTLVFFRGV